MSWTGDKERYEKIARSIDPAVRLTTKDGWFWHALGSVLQVVTFGKFSKVDFLERFATTIGPIQAYPSGWADIPAKLIAHESRHTRQSRWFGLWIHPWIGVLPMVVAYLLLPLPVGLAWCRMRLELDAEIAAIRHEKEVGRTPFQVFFMWIGNFANSVSGAAYAWAWPKGWTKRKFRNAVSDLINKGRKK